MSATAVPLQDPQTAIPTPTVTLSLSVSDGQTFPSASYVVGNCEGSARTVCRRGEQRKGDVMAIVPSKNLRVLLRSEERRCLFAATTLLPVAFQVGEA